MKSGLSKTMEFLENKARFKALFLLLLRSEDYVKSDSLADELGVTSRTVKTDIQSLKDELAQIDITVISKRSKGYKLKITDKEYENSIKEFYQIYQSTTIDSEFDTRVQYILRRLLIAKEPVKMEALQKELNSNTSNSLSKELQRVKELLTDYDLTLMVRPHYGMLIQGAAFKKVMLTIRVYKHFNKVANPDFGIPEYNELFFCHQQEKEKIRKVFYRTMIKSRVVFSDINAERFFVYLIYFRNNNAELESSDLGFPELDFEYRDTEEYALVVEIIQKLRNQFSDFKFSEKIIQFLTYLAIISTDLYRFKDCTKENYGSLLELAEETRNFLLKNLSQYLQIDIFDDYTCIKDLLKIMLPISLKIKLKVSDSIDLGYENIRDYENEPVLEHYMLKLCDEFYLKYGYKFSVREQHILFSTFLGTLNRIILEHRKLKLAIIAIDGRLGTQQLKFNLQHHFSAYIEKIETRVLYELDFLNEQTYDYYLCSNYGKNMNINYAPIYFAEEDMTEFEYVDSFRHIFLDAFDYDKVMPSIAFIEMDQKYKFKHFPIEEYFQEGSTYEHIKLKGHTQIHIYFDLSAKTESFQLFSFPKTEDQSLGGKEYYLLLHLAIEEDKQKLRMFLNIINSLAEDREKLIRFCHEKTDSYTNFFL
ncbi:BglG family transcription antiterminator [Enterococcus crotali]|uniref:BglG family transcription antiterminator n=1 Tax=Enterococcus crotali TaxID=1453587 RepID=UPI000AF01B09|nr:HTH domain-containing protein [Enterococcus crotali]